MENKKDIQDLIQKFTNSELNNGELSNFEKHIHENPGVKNELEFNNLLKEILDNEGEYKRVSGIITAIQLENPLMENLNHTNKKYSISKYFNRKTILIGLTTVLTLFICFNYYTQLTFKNNTFSNNYPLANKMILENIDYEEVIVIDAPDKLLKGYKEYARNTKEGYINAIKLIETYNTKTKSDAQNEFFNIIEIEQKDEVKSQFNRFLNKEITQEEFENILRKNSKGKLIEAYLKYKIESNSDIANFYLAFSFLKLEKWEKAIELFKEEPSEVLKEETEWYLSLALLKNNQLEEGIASLEKIRTTDNHLYKNKANDLFLKL